MSREDTKGLRTGVIIGRFQAPYLHAGHKHLLNAVQNENDLMLVILGCTVDDKKDYKNPYSFEERQELIQKSYPKAMFSFITDCPGDDITWSAQVDYIALQFENPLLYGSRDSFIPHYSGLIPYKLIPSLEGFSATKVREMMKLNPVEEVLKVSAVANPRHPYEVLAKLMEEVGELAQEVNIQEGFLNKPKGSDGVLGEACDVIQCAIDLIHLSYPGITPVEITEKLMEKNEKWKSLMA